MEQVNVNVVVAGAACQVAERLGVSGRALVLGLLALVERPEVEAELRAWFAAGHLAHAATVRKIDKARATHEATRAADLAAWRQRRLDHLAGSVQTPDGRAWLRSAQGRDWLADTHTSTGAERFPGVQRAPLTWDDPEAPGGADTADHADADLEI
jgi:hypothetical protein